MLLLDDGSIYARDDAVVLRRRDGTELSFRAPAVRALYAMSRDWVEAAGADAMYALRTTAGREGLSVLPAAALPGIGLGEVLVLALGKDHVGYFEGSIRGNDYRVSSVRANDRAFSIFYLEIRRHRCCKAMAWRIAKG